jgi:hypothetical protein
MGDTIYIGEAALGICFPLKAFSSHPMHPVPHFSIEFFESYESLLNKISIGERIQKIFKKNKKKRVVC